MNENKRPQPADDVSAEEPIASAEASSASELEKRLGEANDKMLRALAEVDNIRKRAERERQDTAKFAVSSFARDLLGVADNLKRALNAIPQDARAQDERLNSIYAGVEATERELLRALESNGIKKIDPLGQKFDPNLHEVLFESPAEGKEAGTILQVVAPGYMIHDRLLRPARVGVAAGEARQEGSVINQEI